MVFWERPQYGMSYQAQSVAGGGTRDSYGLIHGAAFDYTGWLEGGHGARVEAGLFIDVGRPAIIHQDWHIDDHELDLVLSSVSGSYLHALVDVSSRRAVTPYVGAGLGIFAGIERLHLEANRFAGAESLAMNDTGGWTSFAVHALLGLEFRMSSRLYGTVEARWVQAGRGSFSRWTGANNAEEQAVQDEADRIVRRPDFNFTGPRLSVGVRW